MEAVITILLLLGALTASSALPDEAITKVCTKASVSEVSTLTTPQRQPVFGGTQPRYRDLTIPYEKQIAQSSSEIEDGCDD